MMSDTHPVVGIQCPVRFIGVSAGEPMDERHYAANPVTGPTESLDAFWRTSGGSNTIRGDYSDGFHTFGS